MIEPDTAPGNTSFVAGFIQSNVGDTSPNTCVLRRLSLNRTEVPLQSRRILRVPGPAVGRPAMRLPHLHLRQQDRRLPRPRPGLPHLRLRVGQDHRRPPVPGCEEGRDRVDARARDWRGPECPPVCRHVSVSANFPRGALPDDGLKDQLHVRADQWHDRAHLPGCDGLRVRWRHHGRARRVRLHTGRQR